MISPENPIVGISRYFRTLPDGTEESCGIRLDLTKVSPKIAAATMKSRGDKPISVTIILNGNQPPVDFLNADLGGSLKQREGVLDGIAQMAREWGNVLIIMEGRENQIF